MTIGHPTPADISTPQCPHLRLREQGGRGQKDWKRQKARTSAVGSDRGAALIQLLQSGCLSKPCIMTIAIGTQRWKVRSYKTLNLDKYLQATNAEQEWNFRKEIYNRVKVRYIYCHSGLQPPARYLKKKSWKSNWSCPFIL